MTSRVERLTEPEKVRHLLRRFGLGAGRYESRPYEQMGLKKATETLLNDDLVDEGFPISPWEFGAQLDGNLDSGAYQLSGWWALRMMMTKRPLQEKLTLFWHDHFAIDAEKVAELPIMAGYLDTFRQKGRGRFRDLLQAVFKQGAVFIFLDNHASNRIHPNENFARELMELFTLGIGNYTEKDVQEMSRAFTGWSVHYLGTGFDANYDKLRVTAAKNNLAMNNVCYVPAIHDEGQKAILGTTKNWNAEQVLDMLADHPQTIRYITTKLWEWFAYEGPSEAVLERLARAWKTSNGEIRSVLRAIVNAPEFWSDACYRQKPKSPVDYTMGIYRSFDGFGDTFLAQRGKPKSEYEPIKKEIRDAAGTLYYFMSLQGMRLLFPPNVAGWDWGEAWINSSSMAERIKLAGYVFYGGGNTWPYAVWMANKLKTDDKVTTSEQLVRAYADILDIPLDPASTAVLIEACDKAGGVKALDNKDASANLFARLTRLAFGIPASQLC